MIEPGRWTAVAVVSGAAGSTATDSAPFFAVYPDGANPSSYTLDAAGCQDVTDFTPVTWPVAHPGPVYFALVEKAGSHDQPARPDGPRETFLGPPLLHPL